MNKQEHLSPNLKVEVLENQVTVIECSVQSFAQMIQIWSSLEVGIITSKFGISESHLQLDLLLVLMFAVILLIFMMDIYLPVNIQILNSFNFGISELVNQLKILVGMRVCLQKNHVWFIARNFRKVLEISSLQEAQELMKLKFLMETICSSHVLKLEILVEQFSQLISAIVEICSLAVVAMVSSESSM